MNSNVYCTVRRSFVVLKRAFVLSPPFLSRLLELSHQTHQIHCKWGVLVQLCLSFSLAAPAPLLYSLTTLPYLLLILGWIDNFWLLITTTTSHSPMSVERSHPVPLNAWTLCVCVFVCAVGCVYIILYYDPRPTFTSDGRSSGLIWGLGFLILLPCLVISHRIASYLTALLLFRR